MLSVCDVWDLMLVSMLGEEACVGGRVKEYSTDLSWAERSMSFDPAKVGPGQDRVVVGQSSMRASLAGPDPTEVD